VSLIGCDGLNGKGPRKRAFFFADSPGTKKACLEDSVASFQ
jgi:hypothetical protein